MERHNLGRLGVLNSDTGAEPIGISGAEPLLIHPDFGHCRR